MQHLFVEVWWGKFSGGARSIAPVQMLKRVSSDPIAHGNDCFAISQRLAWVYQMVVGYTCTSGKLMMKLGTEWQKRFVEGLNILTRLFIIFSGEDTSAGNEDYCRALLI